MSGTNSPQGGLTRRSFLKTTAAVAGATALVGGASLTALADNAAPVVAEEQIFSGCCRPNCQMVCHLNIHVRDGKVVRTSMAPMPEEEYNRICIKGLSHPQRIYAADRIKYPMKRVEGSERGAGEWERISWEEAIDAIIDKWKSCDDPRSIIISGGSGHYAYVNSTYGIMNRFCNAMGTTWISTMFDINFVYGFYRSIGVKSLFWNANESKTLKHAKNIILWGGNTTETQTHEWHFISEAQQGGTKLTVIDPMFNTCASKADQWIPIRPASDTAMCLYMVKLVIDNDWIDHDFAKNHTVAPLLVKESDGKYLRMSDLGVELEEGAANPIFVWDAAAGEAKPVDEVADPALFGSFEVQGIKVNTALTLLRGTLDVFTPEYVEEVTTVKPEVIEALTKEYALEGPSTIYPQLGPDRYQNGYWLPHAMVTLASLTGNYGKLGAGCGLNVNYGWIEQAPMNKPIEGKSTTDIAFNAVLDVIDTHTYQGQPYPEIKCLFFYNNNSLGNFPDQNRWIAAFEKVGFVVTVERYMTSTAQYSDILLPGADWFEVEDIGSFATHPFMILQEKAIEPPYECKSNSEICRILADRMGYGDVMSLTDDEYVSGIFELTPAAIANNVTLDRVKKEKVIRHSKFPVIHAEGGQFPTATGRAEFYVENPFMFSYWGQEYKADEEHLPKFVPPGEAWYENPLIEKYPYHVITEHTRWRAHTQFSNIPVLRELDPEPVVKINPVDAEAKGLKGGDLVRLFNDRGHAVGRVVIDNGMRPGLLNMPRGWQRNQCVAGNYQELSPSFTSAPTGNGVYFDVLVDIEKYEEA